MGLTARVARLAALFEAVRPRPRVAFGLESATYERVSGWVETDGRGARPGAVELVVGPASSVAIPLTRGDDASGERARYSFGLADCVEMDPAPVQLRLEGERDPFLTLVPPGWATSPAMLDPRGDARSAVAALQPARDPFRAFLRNRLDGAAKHYGVLKRANRAALRAATTLREAERTFIERLRIFDAEYYCGKLGATPTDPLGHYLDVGRFVGLDPNEFFNLEQYFNRYQDVLGLGMDPLLHYEVFGWREGRDLVPRFDGAWYLKHNQDVAQRQLSPLHHYMAWGRREGRTIRKPPARRGEIVRPAGGARKRLLIACHDCEIGGAQRIAQLFAEWLLASTRYDVAFVAVRSGANRGRFAGIAPTLVLSDYAEEALPAAVAAFAPDGFAAIFVNSIAAGSVLKHFDPTTPVVAYIHELRILLDQYPEEVELTRARATHVIGGSDAVVKALGEIGFDDARLSRTYSFVEAGHADRAAAREAARTALGLAPDDFVVMACGVIHWRKSPEIFIEVAQQLTERGVAARFVWLGGGPDREACEAAVAEAGLHDVVRFTGYEPDVPGKLAAGDVFCLPSREDPFPLVGLYAAQAGMPVVCFREAGGMPEFTDRGAGTAVPFLDATAMADAILAYVDDEARRRREGACGGAIVAEHHTIATAGPRLLSAIRRAAALKPEVSVIVPNYNYERFLPERLASIEAQTFQDFEVILLDDASTDGSVPILEAFAARRADTRLIVNEANSGSPFVQWLRGFGEACADVVWIAEADDACDPELVASLLPAFDDRAVRLAWVGSVPIDTNGNVLGDYRTLYLDRIAPGRFEEDVEATDHEEASAGLGVANTIPNASAVMLRRYRPDAAFVAAVTEMELCGDWFMYLRAMRGGTVRFVARTLNRHRRHAGTVTHRLEGSRRYFDELATVRTYVGATYRQSEAARERIARFVDEDIARFGLDHAEGEAVRRTLSHAPREKRTPTLLVVAPDLSPGGGQMFAMRLANTWAERGGRAILLSADKFATHPKVIATVSPEVAVLTGRRNGTARWSVSDAVRRFDVDVVHSTIWWGDCLVEASADALPPAVPWLTTMHGCHETLLTHPGLDPQFRQRYARMKERIDAWVYTADKNTAVFDALGRPARTVKIDNGVPFAAGTPIARTALGVREEALLLLVATRAIPEKGWDDAVWLTGELNERGISADLVLIGEGVAADALAADRPPHVHLFGYADNLGDFIAAADVGLLPSRFEGESLPLVVLEMMAAGLPVVATDRGEIPHMIGTDADAGGIVVPIANGRVDRSAFAAAVERLADPATRAAFGARARQRYAARYQLGVMVDRYAALYEELIAAKAG